MRNGKLNVEAASRLTTSILSERYAELSPEPPLRQTPSDALNSREHADWICDEARRLQTDLEYQRESQEESDWTKSLQLATHDLSTDRPVICQLRRWGHTLHRSAKNVPSRAGAPDKPYASAIAEEIGIDPSQLSMKDAKLLLAEFGNLFGYEVIRKTRSNTEVTLEELSLLSPPAQLWRRFDFTDDKEQRDLAGELQALSANEAGPGSLAVPYLQRFIADSKPLPDRIRSVAKVMLAHINDHFAPDGLPEDTRERIRLFLDRRGLSIIDFATRLQIQLNALPDPLARLGDDALRTKRFHLRLKEKIGGRNRLTRADKGWLEAAELELDVPKGSLNRLGQYGRRGVGTPADHFPADLPTMTSAQRLKVALFLPEGFEHLGLGERRCHVEQALHMIDESVTPEKAARVRLQQDTYAIRGNLPTMLDKEFRSIAHLYASPIAPTDKVADRPVWSEGTCLIREGFLGLLMGWLASIGRGAAAIDRDRLSVALLVQPKLVESFIAFRNTRRDAAFKAEGVTKRVAFTEEYICILEFLSVLFHPKNGWATQSTTLRHRLITVDRHADERERVDPDGGMEADPDRFITPSFVASACPHLGDHDPTAEDANEAAWKAACKRAYDQYRRMIRNQRRRVVQSRDSHEPIAAILRSAQPLDAMKLVVRGLREELGKVAPYTKAYAEILRDLVAVQIEMRAGFRRRTLLDLDWRRDDRGHLRREAAGWWLRVPRDLFKNSEGPYFRDGEDGSGHAIYRDYADELLDVDGFHGELQSYLDVYREILLGERVSDALLVGSRNAKDARLTEGALDQMARRIWRRHLMWNERTRTGFKGVYTTVGWHAWRHVIATDTLKRSGSYTLAADSIQDSVDMVQATYTRYTSRDRDRELREVRGRSLSAPILALA